MLFDVPPRLRVHLGSLQDRASILAEAGQHCDVHTRLRDTRWRASGRGLYLAAIERVLTRECKLGAYQPAAPGTFSLAKLYPVTECIERLVIGGSLLRGPRHVARGMYDIGRLNAVAFSESLLGRSVLRLLSREPVGVLKQAATARRLSTNYGCWRLEVTSGRSAMMHFSEEYLWIESYLLGAAVGTFESVGIRASIEVELDSHTAGRHLIRWT